MLHHEDTGKKGEHMKSKYAVAAVAIGALLAGSSAWAGKLPPRYDWVTAGSASATRSDTRLYAGLNWRLGAGMTPALVLGAASTKTKSNGDTHGANLAFHLELAGGVKPGKLKLSYLDGKENLQGMLGLGYDFLKKAPLLGLDANLPYATIGIDAYMDHGFVPNASVHSMGKFKKPNSRQTNACVEDPAGNYSDPDCTTPYVD
jgi:hypothetical protein